MLINPLKSEANNVEPNLEVNKDKVIGEGYEKVNTSNQSCIDNIDLYILIKDNIIKDICFTGEACAISISSTSIMISLPIVTSIVPISVMKKILLNEKEYNKDLLNEGLVYEDIYKQSSRKTCASLPYRGIVEVLEKY